MLLDLRSTVFLDNHSIRLYTISRRRELAENSGYCIIVWNRFYYEFVYWFTRIYDRALYESGPFRRYSGFIIIGCCRLFSALSNYH